MSVALPTALEKPKDRFICTPDRARNRISSPRLAASGLRNTVGKGSQQHRSVISGKALTFRVGFRSPCLEIRATRKVLDASRCRVDSRLVTVDGQVVLLETFLV